MTRWPGALGALAVAMMVALLALAVALWAPRAAADHGDPATLATQYRITEAVLSSAAGERRVQLPHQLEPRDFDPAGSRVRYRLLLELDQLPAQAFALYVRKISVSGLARVNGQDVGVCAMGHLEGLRCLHQPQLFVGQADRWRLGRNEIEFEIYANKMQPNGLSAVVVGSPAVLYEGEFGRDYFIRTEVLRGMSWVALCLGLVSLAVKLALRGYSVYQWFGLASVVSALSNLNMLVQAPAVDPVFYAWLIFSARPVSGVLLLLALLALFRQETPWRRRILLGYGLVILVGIGLSPTNRSLVALLGAPLVLLGGLQMGALVWWTWQSRRISHLLMAVSFGAVMAAGVHDWLRLTTRAAFEGTYLLAYASSGVLLVMAGVIVAMLATALRTAQHLTTNLTEAVAEKEQALRNTYEERLAAERNLARQSERERLLRDMHDGLGSSLTTARLLLEQGNVSAREAAEVLRESLDDLRLVFDVSDNDEGDLALALAEFRFRLDQRLIPTGLATALRMDLGGMPALSGVTLLQLLRIVQEAVSNAVRHARANHLRLSAVWQAQDQTLRLAVHDDGQGIDASSSAGSGRGLTNMRLRAESIGAQLVIDSTMAGTRIELRLELRPGSTALKPASPARLDISPEQTALELADNLPVGVYAIRLTPEGKAEFIFLNKRWLAMVELERDAVLADPQSAFSLIHPDERDAFLRLNQDTFAREQPFTWEGRLVIRGQIRWYRIESVPRHLSDRRTVWLGAMIDVTDRQHRDAIG